MAELRLRHALVSIALATALAAVPPAAAADAASVPRTPDEARLQGETLLAGGPSQAFLSALALDGRPAPAASEVPDLATALDEAAAARGETVPPGAADALAAGLAPAETSALAGLLHAAATATDLAAAGDHGGAGAVLAEAAEQAARELLHAPAAATTIGTVLRIGDGANDVYTTQFLVHVDVGGSDTYVGASSAGASLASGFPVMVALDLAGDDLYTATATGSGAAATVVAQGAGNVGVGVLVDAAGDDVYTASSTNALACALGNPATTNVVVAQGAGLTGAGVLADLDGRDAYTATASSCGAAAGPAHVVAQGGGELGVGALVDLDTAPDTAAPVTGVFDDPDAYTATATSNLLPVSSTRAEIGSGLVVAQGGGWTGAGAFVDATGGDALTATASGGNALTAAQGGGIGGGAGVLADGLGDDTRAATATGSLTPSLVLSGSFSSVTVTVGASNGATDVAAQGGASTGIGVLVDLAGDDENVARSQSTTSATASATTTFSGGTTTATATASSGGTRTSAQGGADVGLALHVDATGDDLYEATSASSTTATATAAGGAANTATATATCGPAKLTAQGGALTGAGGLADALGTDSYTTAANVVCTATQNGAPGTTSAGGTTVTQHGRGLTGAGVLADLDGVDAQASTHATGWTNGGCWTNSPPPGDTNIGLGLNWDGPLAIPPSCIPPPA